jgi:hypothetical protein
VSHVTRELFFSFHLSIIRNLPATCDLRIAINLGDVIVEAGDV